MAHKNAKENFTEPKNVKQMLSEAKTTSINADQKGRMSKTRPIEEK